MIVEIQCLAFPPGPVDDKYGHIEAAIAVIEGCGLRYEVGALGTFIEGEPDEIWPLLRQVHEACLDAGADGLVSVIKVEQSSAEVPPTIDSLTSKYRT